MIGESLGGYEVVAGLGSGGMGGVWVGLHPETEERVAIKTLHSRFVADERMLPRFIREAEAYRRLSHPNIVAYRGSGVHGKIYFILLEYVEGKTLDALIERVGGPLGTRRTVLILRDLLLAVGYAHEAGVLHRDIKPNNVMVSSLGEVKLLDFGVAAADDRLLQTSVGAILGSFQYSAPEQNQGQQADERSDLYSVGLLAWEMLTGVRALNGTNLIEITSRQLTEGVAPVTSTGVDIPEGLAALVTEMVVSSRNDRIESAALAYERLVGLELLD